MSFAIVIISALRVKFVKINIKYSFVNLYMEETKIKKKKKTLSRMYNFAGVVCKQMEVLPVFLCRAH